MFSPTKDTLLWAIPLALFLDLILMIVAFVKSFDSLKKGFMKIDKHVWVFLLIFVLTGFYLRMFIAVHDHRTFFDEDIFLNIAQNIRYSGKACMCNYGTPTECYDCLLNKQPHGLQFLTGVFFLFFGVKEQVAYNIVIIMGTLSIALLFLLVYLMFRNQNIALFSALLLALTPIHIKWSGTASLAVPALFFTLATFVVFIVYTRSQNKWVFLLALSLLVYTVQMRTESLVTILFCIVLLILYNWGKNLNAIKDYKVLLMILLVCILLVPHLWHLDQVKDSNWGARGAKLSPGYAKKNAVDNLAFFKEDTRFPIVFTILSIIGLVYSLIYYRKTIVFSVIWFAGFFIVFMLFYAGSFNYGTDDRYSIHVIGPLLVFTGIGLDFLRRYLEKAISFTYVKNVLIKTFVSEKHHSDFLAKVKEKTLFKKAFVKGILFIVMCIFFIPFYPYVSTFGEKAWDAKASHDFTFNTTIPKGCWIFSHVPTMLIVKGDNAVQIGNIQNKNLIEKLKRESGCLFYHEDYWCVNVKVYREGICSYVKENFNAIEYASYEEQGKRFAFYKLEDKA